MAHILGNILKGKVMYTYSLGYTFNLDMLLLSHFYPKGFDRFWSHFLSYVAEF